MYPASIVISSFSGLYSWLVKGSQIFRELDFAHLVGLSMEFGSAVMFVSFGSYLCSW